MLMNGLYFLLAACGLGFLVFIHELGHYFVARREGMTIEAFSIGFGKPLFTWERKGVKWQVCWLPFGGYVRIAGMERRGKAEPHEIPDGFYGKRPWARIKVALAGPFVNIACAFLLFGVIWVSGGREKPFAEYTHIVGWVDPRSAVYQTGMRPGDQITEFDHSRYKGFSDLIYAALLQGTSIPLRGYEVNYLEDRKTPFTAAIKLHAKMSSASRAAMVSEMLSPANVLIYRGPDDVLPKESPMAQSGIQDHDRILWADGELIFSRKQLASVINAPNTLLTVKRGETSFVTRIPKLKVSDLKLTPLDRADLDDWRYEANLNKRLDDLLFIPYQLSQDGCVQGPALYFDEAFQERSFSLPSSEKERATSFARPLEGGDQIVAVDGVPVSNVSSLLAQLQDKRVHLVVVRRQEPAAISWREADLRFFSDINFSALSRLVSHIGTSTSPSTEGDLVLLRPVVPLPLASAVPAETKEGLMRDWEAQKRAIGRIKNSQEREEAGRLLEEQQKRLMLGIGLQDRQVIYNPSPLTLFAHLFTETWHTLGALASGYLSPKWMAGPVGIVQVMHDGWAVGFREALFWLGVVSLNLGLINLFPIPVLDGGHVCFSLWEWITKRPIKARTMERLVIPFLILFIGLFIYLTYNDLLRVLHRLLG